MNSYDRVKQILDASVSHGDIGAHGTFWRDTSRDEFVEKNIFGYDLLVVGNGNESNLVKALRGESPFGADLPNPPPDAVFSRMPVGRDPVAEEDIEYIRNWIDEGCPDSNETEV